MLSKRKMNGEVCCHISEILIKEGEVCSRRKGDIWRCVEMSQRGRSVEMRYQICKMLTEGGNYRRPSPQ